MQELDPGSRADEEMDSTKCVMDGTSEGTLYEADAAPVKPPTLSLPTSGGGWLNVPMGDE